MSSEEDIGRESLCVSSDVKDIADEAGKSTDDIEDDLFIMENLGPVMQENQHAHTTVKVLVNDPCFQPPGLEIVESVSLSQVLEVDTIRCNDDDCAVINGSVDQNKEVGIHEKQGVKRALEECSSTGSSVRVVYSSLPSSSKRKLEEFLSQWSDWHARHCAPAEDPAYSLESGEETYFPALHVGLDKASTVSFSMDVHASKKQCKESVSLNDECSPLYDRGFAVGLVSDSGATEESGVDLREAPRCFNCGSYNHPLSGCAKPFNKTAVNSARKEFQSKKSQNGSPRVPTRYYQDSPGGKFDGLKPGALSAETRKLLGLEELDPPPWLNRMRELGYPPGYSDSAEEDQPSGIAIFGDDISQNMDVRSDLPLDLEKSQKKMINFPGINAPIPENADQRRWATPSSPIVSDIPLSRPDNRWNLAQVSIPARNSHGAYVPRNHFDGPSSPFGYGSPPMSQHMYNYHPSEPFSPVGIPIPGSPHYGRPFLHYNYNHGSF